MVGCEPQVIEQSYRGPGMCVSKGTGLLPGLGLERQAGREAGSWSEDGVPGGETHSGKPSPLPGELWSEWNQLCLQGSWVGEWEPGQ